MSSKTGKFQSQAAFICFILKEDPLEPVLFQWLEFEVKHFLPSLQQYRDAAFHDKGSLKNALQHVEATLNQQNTAFLTSTKGGKEPGAIDAILFFDVHSTLNDKNATLLTNRLKGVDGSFPRFIEWYNNVEESACISKLRRALFGQDAVPSKESVSKSQSKAGGDGSKGGKKDKALTPSTDNSVPDDSISGGEWGPVFNTSDEDRESAAQIFRKDSNALPKVPQYSEPRVPLRSEGVRNILVTSALPYVNNVPHLGNIIGSVLSADVYSRFCRLRGYNVVYICGTDEYGTATETKAMQEGLTPREICDKYHAIHAACYKWFNIGFDFFGRTTTEVHGEIACDIFHRLNDRGYIFPDSVEQLFCEKCSKFLADRFVEGTCPFCSYSDARGDQCDKCGKLINAIELKEPRCKVCSNAPIIKSSRHLFLDLPKLQPLLENYLEPLLGVASTENASTSTRTGHLWSNSARVITSTWLRDGLKPRCITRDLKWGVHVPLAGFEDKVFYVWFDAPIGYLSILANYSKEHWREWWHGDTVRYHVLDDAIYSDKAQVENESLPARVQMINFMAKDNVPFHSVIFPACLLGTEDQYTVVEEICATEYLNYEDTKFSKSRGIGVFGDNAQDTNIPSDIWRYYLLYIRPENQDSAFQWDDFMLKNNELMKNLGNFVNRALTFLSKNFDGVIPSMELMDVDKAYLSRVSSEMQFYVRALENVKLKDGLRHILEISDYGNKYITLNSPWVHVKKPETKARAGTVIGVTCNVASWIGCLLQPYMPNLAEQIFEQCNTPVAGRYLIQSSSLSDTNNQYSCTGLVAVLPTGHEIGKPVPLIKEMEPCLVSTFKEKYGGQRS